MTAVTPPREGLLARAWPTPSPAGTAAHGSRHHGDRRPWLSWLVLPAAMTLLLLAIAWSGSSASSDGASRSLVPTWFKPLIQGGWRGSYAGEGDASSFLRESEIGSGGVTCAQVLGVKKVALLFVTGAHMPHDALWRLWLESAAGLLPQQALPSLLDAACGPVLEKWLLLLCACYPKRVTGVVAAVQPPWQYLFSLYVHSPPWGTDGYQGWPENSLFRNHVIKDRVKTQAGHISRVDAMRRLLQQALKDPLNDRFVLLSDGTVPLYDPLTFYQQVMFEERSRVKACASPDDMASRWKDAMQRPALRKEHWRKSSPFFSLTRSHAQLAAADEEVFQSFRDHCADCQPEEHYVPTLLASLGRENETDCSSWGVAAVEGSEGTAKEYRPQEATPKLFAKARGNCSGPAALAARDAHRMFSPWEPVLTAPNRTMACQRLRSFVSRPYEHPLLPSCSLAAGRFVGEAAPAVLRLFAGTCAAAEASPPGAMTEGEAAIDSKLYLLRGRACTLVRQHGAGPAAS